MKFTRRAVDECLRAYECKACGYDIEAEHAVYYDHHEHGPEVYHVACYEGRVRYAQSVIRRIADGAKQDGLPQTAQWLQDWHGREGRKILRPSGADLRKVLSGGAL